MLPILSEAQKKQLKLEIEAEVYSRSFYEFFKASAIILYPQVQWQWNWHFQYVCEILQEEVERICRGEEKTQDLIINMPFRSGKSILISQIFPVWCWIKESSLAIMQVSHSELLAVKHSHAAKMLLQSEWFLSRFPSLALRVDTNAKNNYMTNTGGKRISFGISSSIIGEGCNIQICDDLNAPNDSQANMDVINTTYTETLYTRLNNPSVDLRIILQQRISDLDICGFLIKSNPDKYRQIIIPARLTPQVQPAELAMYYTNGLFWESRFNEAVLQDFQKTLGSRAYYGQLMQMPQSLEGGILKRAWYQKIGYNDFQDLVATKKPSFNIFLDSAYTANQKNDASAVVIACAIDNKLYIVKALNFFMEFPELILQLKTMSNQFKTRLIYIETKASGLSIKQQLVRDGFNCKDLKAIGDKTSRVNGVTPTIESGRVFIVEDSWNENFLSEMAGFGNGGVDNLVDASTYAVDTLLNKNSFSYSML